MASEWKQIPIIECIDLIGGGTPKTSVAEYWDGDIPWLSVKDFNNDYRHVYTTEKHITEAGLKNSSTKLLQKDDIIISARGTVGEMAMIPFPMALNQSCYGIRAKDGINSTFLYYLLKNSISKLKLMTHGSVFDTITRDTFATLIVGIPDKKTQDAIAATLAAIDDKIELNNKINDNLQQQAQTLFAERFCRRNGDSIPVSWSLVSLGDVAVISNKSFNPLKQPETMLEHYSIPAFDETRYPVFELSTEIKSNKFIVDSDCFMISKLNPTTKKLANATPNGRVGVFVLLRLTEAISEKSMVNKILKDHYILCQYASVIEF